MATYQVLGMYLFSCPDLIYLHYINMLRGQGYLLCKVRIAKYTLVWLAKYTYGICHMSVNLLYKKSPIFSSLVIIVVKPNQA